VSRRYRRPDKARTRRLLVRYHKHGDQGARERVIQEQLPLAEFLARKFAGRGEPLDDLVQVASVGLIKAVDRFDVDRKIEFSTYATPNILGEIKRYFRDKGWAMRVPRGLQELRQSAKEVIRDETVRTGRSPSLQELAEALDADVEGVAEALTLGRAYNTASLDAPVSQDEPEGDTIIDLQADDRSQIDGLEDRLLLQEAIDSLKGQQQQILRLRFNEGKTQTEIADHIGVSQMHVSRLLRRAIEDLRVELDHLEKDHEEDHSNPGRRPCRVARSDVAFWAFSKSGATGFTRARP
jgi:RNA polymerase sigma-B factor